SSPMHAGLNAAAARPCPACLGGVASSTCNRNAQSYVTRLDQRKPVAQQIRAIFNAPDSAEAERLLRQAIESWRLSP
ncbi:MAG: hypothetical protein IPP03_22930, partial [Dechloromonas sp.]|nr:hypothetical protein [Candidatus Dechloromonas phosphoritropha]